MITKLNTFRILKSINGEKTYRIEKYEKENRTIFSFLDIKSKKTIGKVILDTLYLDSKNKYGTVGDEYSITDYFYLRYINIDEDFRGQGYSKIFLKEIIAEASKSSIKEMYLYAIPDGGSDNLNLDQLINLYSSLGFKLLKREKHGADMLLYL